jgi:hypothetical protein
LSSSNADALSSSFKVENFIKGIPPSSIEAAFGSSWRDLHRISHFPPLLHNWIHCHALHIAVPVVAGVFERREQCGSLVIEEN